MGIKCIFGYHAWDGCKCTICGKIRDEQHDWTKDCEICSKCGRTRADKHDWSKDCEKCSICGKTRAEQHDWSKDCNKCSKCGMTRENQHDWNGCKCKKCDNSRNEQHEWNGCKCDVCGRRKHELNLELTKCKHCGMITGVSRNIINAKYIEHFFYEVNMSIKVGIFSSFNYDFGIKMSNEGAMRKLKDGLSDMRRFSGACDMELLYINPESYLHEIISFLNNKKNWDSPKINQIINSANDDLAIIKKDNMHASWNGLFFNEIKI